MKFKTKISLMLLVIGISPILIGSILTLRNGQKAIEEITFNQLEAINNLKIEELNNWFDLNITLVEYFANDIDTIEIIQNISEDSEISPQNELDIFQKEKMRAYINNRGIKSISLLNSSGDIYISTNESLEGKTISDQQYFIKGLNATFIDEIKLDNISPMPALYISTPVHDETGQVIGVVAANLDFNNLSDIIAYQAIETLSLETYLVNKNSIFATNTRFKSEALLNESIDTEGVKNCLAGNNGIGIYKDYRGIDVLGVYHWLPDKNICVLTEVDQEEGIAPLDKFDHFFTNVGVGIAFIAILIGSVFIRSLTDPVQQLARAANEVGSGNLGYKVSIKNRDELGQLGNAFNQMSTHLAQLNEKATQRQNLLVKLSNIEAQIQNALTLEEIYKSIDTQINEMGFVSVIFTYNQAQDNIDLQNTSIAYKQLQEFDQILGIKKPTFSIKVAKSELLTQIIHDNETIFIEDIQNSKDTLLQLFLGDDSSKVFKKLGIKNSAYTPLIQSGEVIGLLEISGNIYSEDLPVIKTFAGKITSRLETIHLLEETNSWAQELENRVQKRTEELQEALNNLHRSNEELEQFAYVASHDLQEPLRMISSYLQLLEKRYGDQLDSDAKEFIQYAVDGAHRLKSMIQDLLTFSKIDNHHTDFKTIDLNQILAQVIEDNTLFIQEANAKINSATLPKVEGNDKQLKLVFQNLIHNGIKFNKAPVPTIEVTSESLNKSEIQINVSDNGIGIDPQYFDKLFVIFKRLHSSSEFSGSGIGLATTKRIIEHHQGKIWVSSQLDKGTTFSFTLKKGKES